MFISRFGFCVGDLTPLKLQSFWRKILFYELFTQQPLKVSEFNVPEKFTVVIPAYKFQNYLNEIKRFNLKLFKHIAYPLQVIVKKYFWEVIFYSQ